MDPGTVYNEVPCKINGKSSDILLFSFEPIDAYRLYTIAFYHSFKINGIIYKYV